MVDLKGKYAIVLDKKGGFIKVRNNGKFVVGNEIDIGLKVTNHNFKALSKMVSVAAGLLLIFGIGIGGYAYSMPYNYINVDINPSLEFTVNIFGVVLDVKGLNRDGEDLIKTSSYNHIKIDKAVGDFIEAALDKGFFEDVDKNAVMITVSGKNDEKLSNIQEELVKVANNTLDQSKVQSEVVTEKITLNKRDNAKELGISPGKLVLIEKLKKENPEIKVEEYKEKPVKDILTSIKQAKNKTPKKPKDQIKTLPNKENRDFDMAGDHEKDNKVNTDKNIKEDVPKKLPNKDSIQLGNELKDKEREAKEEKNRNPEDNKPKDNKAKSNEPKLSESKDNKPKDNNPKDNKPKDNEPKDSKPKDSKPKGNEIKDNEPKDNKPKHIEPKGDDLKDDTQNNNRFIDNAQKNHEEKVDEFENNEQGNIELQDRMKEDKIDKDLRLEGIDEKDSSEILNKENGKDEKNTLDF